MIKLRIFLILVLFFSFFSCSNNSKDKLSAQSSPQTNENPRSVASISVPPIEMKSIPATEEKKTTGALKTEIGIPNKNENKRLPQDFSIGELGQGTVPSAVYLAVKDFCNSLTGSNFSVKNVQFLPSAEQENIIALIGAIKPNQYRLGGGRIEGKDRYSFLLRLVGPEESASGVVYIQLTNTSWIIDDLSLEKDTKGVFDPLQYKHFL
jgi:hypothetical protein